MRKFAIAASLLLAAIAGNAQERLVGLERNPLLDGKQNAVSRATIIRSATPLALPFIDDFSAPTGSYPDQTKWEGKGVFVNNSYGRNMPTVGIATLDAADATGKLYNVKGVFSAPADTLASREINLAYPTTANAYLSFYYQAGGLGDMPELADSLTLQFYSNSGRWVSVWSVATVVRDSAVIERNHLTGTILTKRANELSATFFTTAVKIDRPEFLYSGFRFRFVNYASVTVNSFTPGRASNSDHWNLDMVYLNIGRTANDLIPDVALSKPQTSLSSIYEAIPWIHYNSDAQTALFGSQLQHTFTITNLGLDPSSVGFNMRIKPTIGGGGVYNFAAGQQNIPAVGETRNVTVTMPPYSFYSNNPDSAAFEVISYLVTDTDPATLRRELRQNDSSRYVQAFYDYYAYDDGSPENGYGLFGSGAATGMAAVKFYSYASDSLRGVYLYFNHTIDNANAGNKIKLAVWADAGTGQPGELLYVQDAVSPGFSDKLNGFVAYKFNKAIPIARKTNFFVGWMQTSEDFVNIGFDRNRNHQDKAFFFLNGAWSPSAFEGSLMLRPIFCRAGAFPSNAVLPPAPTQSSASIILSPNPASDVIRLQWKNSQNLAEVNSKLELYDMRGRLVLEKQTLNGESIGVSTLAEGMYFARISNGNRVETRKIIIIR